MGILIQLQIIGNDEIALLAASKRLYEETGILLGTPHLTDEGQWMVEGVAEDTDLYCHIEGDTGDR